MDDSNESPAEMSLTICANLAASKSCTRSESDSTLPPAVVEFDHTNLLDGGFFAENEKTFLSAVSASTGSRSSQQCLSQQGRSVETRATPSSRFEQVPYEMMLSVLELLDISSLVTLASVNTYVRTLIQRLPDIVKIQQSIYSARAISRMYTTGTANNFRLKHFMQAFMSSECGICNDSRDFAVSFCPMLGCRICRGCQHNGSHQRYIPAEMAVDCLGLNEQDMMCSGGFARIPIQFFSEGEACCGQTGPLAKTRRINAIFHRSAVAMAIHKYAEYGGMLYVKLLANDYLLKRHIGFGHEPHAADNWIFPGFADAVRRRWKALGVCSHKLKRMLFTSLPYLDPKSYPLRIELGIRCQGCIRDMVYKHCVLPYSRDVWVDIEVHSNETFRDHSYTCSSAQSINKGVCLTFQAEAKLINNLIEKKEAFWPQEEKEAFWPQENQAPVLVEDLTRFCPSNVRWTAKRFRAWFSKSMQRIIDIGQRDLECKRKLAEFARIYNERSSILYATDSKSSNRIKFNFTDEPSEVTNTPSKLTHRTRVTLTPCRKSGLWETGGRSKLEQRLIEQISAISVQEDLENMSPWRVLPEQQHVQKTGTTFVSGERLSETNNVAATPVTVATPTTAMGAKENHGALGSEEQPHTFAEKLQKHGISSDKALVPGLWQMRAEAADSDESDMDSVGSKEDGDGSQESDDSDEEL